MYMYVCVCIYKSVNIQCLKLSRGFDVSLKYGTGCYRSGSKIKTDFLKKSASFFQPNINGILELGLVVMISSRDCFVIF